MTVCMFMVSNFVIVDIFFDCLLTMSLICDSVIWRETFKASSVSSTGLRALE